MWTFRASLDKKLLRVKAESDYSDGNAAYTASSILPPPKSGSIAKFDTAAVNVQSLYAASLTRRYCVIEKSCSELHLNGM